MTANFEQQLHQLQAEYCAYDLAERQARLAYLKKNKPVVYWKAACLKQDLMRLERKRIALELSRNNEALSQVEEKILLRKQQFLALLNNHLPQKGV